MDLRFCSFPKCENYADEWPVNKVGVEVPICDEHHRFFTGDSDIDV